MKFASYLILIITILFVSCETYGSNLNDDLLLSIRNSKLKQFQQLLSKGADPNYRDENGDPQYRPVVMEQAAVNKNSMFLKLCLEHGANPIL